MATENQLSLGSDEQKVSYGLGRQFGEHLSRTHITGIDLEAVIAGMEQAYLGEPSVIPADSLEAAYQAIESKLKMAARELAGRAAKEGVVFLEKNARRNNVQCTESGLQYEILEKGDGDKPQAGSQVRTHYEGRLIDGTVFDSSFHRGEPAVFGVNQVISGWTEALQMMPVGSRWKLFIPAELAYGEQGAGESVPPNAALVFEVQLLEIID